MKYFWSYFYLFYFKRLVAHWQQHLPKRTLTLLQNSSELELLPLELLVPEQASVAFLIPIYNSIWICSFILICHLFIIFYTGIGSVFGSLIVGYARNPSLKQQLFSYAILGFALSEAMGLFCLMMAFLLLFAF